MGRNPRRRSDVGLGNFLPTAGGKMLTMRFDIITLFPKIFTGYLGESLLAKARRRGRIEVYLHDLRLWSPDKKHHKVDDRPYGGGPGMVIRVEPVVECVEAVQQMCDQPGRLLLMSPTGRPLDQALVRELAACQRLILLCGRYEGFDQRVFDLLNPEPVSIGPYVLNGGEVAAMVIMDAVVRWVPGVLGNEDSSLSDSFSHGSHYVKAAQYTRPPEYRGLKVPEVLLSGNHEQIRRWREQDSHRRSEALLQQLQRQESHSKSDPR